MLAVLSIAAIAFVAGPGLFAVAALGLTLWRPARAPRTSRRVAQVADPGTAALQQRQRAMQAEARAALRVPFNRPVVRG